MLDLLDSSYCNFLVTANIIRWIRICGLTFLKRQNFITTYDYSGILTQKYLVSSLFSSCSKTQVLQADKQLIVLRNKIKNYQEV